LGRIFNETKVQKYCSQ